MSEPLTLGIEFSCGETGVGIVRGDQSLANKVAGPADLHARLGGAVSEIAFRMHLFALAPTLQRTAAAADADLAEADAIAVTVGPGLMGALLVGISAVKALVAHLGKSLYGMNHLVGHIAVDLLDHSPLPTLALALLVSGGRISLLHARGLARDIEELDSTIDDAAGGAYDKVARLLDLSYPGGLVIDRATADGDPVAIRFPRGLTARYDLEKHRFDFSFSGLKMAVARWVETARLEGREVLVGDVCASFQEAVTDVLVAKILNAAWQVGVGTILLGGGAAVNSRLHGLPEERATVEGVVVRRPRPGLCTDNGAMITAVGLMAARAGLPPSSLGFSALTGLPASRVVV